MHKNSHSNLISDRRCNILIVVNPLNQINLREWSRVDLMEIQRAWLEYCRNAARADMRLKPDAERSMHSWLSNRFRDSASFGLVAELETRHVGFLIGRIGLMESTPPIIEPRHMGIVEAVYVMEEFRRRGVAASLIGKAVEMMRERQAEVVETVYDAWNEGSAESWRSAGFAPWMVHAYRML
jgi:GNAT superfamily N-acetyltransferase